ncbi:MAG: diacylglycerol kinase family protein [Bacteroidota bacterium]
MRHIAVVCNPLSGKGKPLKLLPLFEAYLKKEGLLFQSFTGKLPDSLAGFSDLVIMGGDGTLNYVLNHFKTIDIPIGYISCGTGNDIGMLLLSDKTFEEQFETAICANPQRVDVGVCNGRLFLNGAGIGFDGWVVKRLLAKSLFKGKAAYYSTVISLLLFYKETRVTIIAGHKNYETELFMLNAANGKSYGGGFRVAPHASITDGWLELIVISRISLLKRLLYLPVIEKGRHLEKSLSFIDYTQVKKISIVSEHLLHAHLDGEHLASKQFDIELLPGKIQVRY